MARVGQRLWPWQLADIWLRSSWNYSLNCEKQQFSFYERKALMPTNRGMATFQMTTSNLNICCNSAVEEKSDLVYLASKLLVFMLTDQLLARYAYFLQNSILWKPRNSFASCKIQSLQVGASAHEGASARKSPSLYLLYVETSCSLQAEFQSLEVQDRITDCDGATRSLIPCCFTCQAQEDRTPKVMGTHS